MIIKATLRLALVNLYFYDSFNYAGLELKLYCLKATIHYATFGATFLQRQLKHAKCHATPQMRIHRLLDV